MLSYVNVILSDKISAYRQGYSCQHVLLKLTDECKIYLDQNLSVGTVLMDLSKVFDYIPHELLIAKMGAYNFDKGTLELVLSYLKDRKQTVNVKGKLSSFLDVLAGVPQGSILGPVLFNIFINDIYDFMSVCDLENFADDNTVTNTAEKTGDIIVNLEDDSRRAIDWFKNNHMIANPDKFKAIIIDKKGTDYSNLTLNINNETINASREVTLLGITIDDKL